jgi:flagellar assembly protein FliH
MSTETLFAKVNYPRLAGEVASDGADQASARGFAAGYAAGARVAATDASVAAADRAAVADDLARASAASVRSALQALESSAVQANALRQPVIAEADAALAAAAIELAEVIIGHELQDPESSARAAIARALSVTAGDEVLVVRMNPADLEVIAGNVHALASARLVGDPTLDRGDAMVETAVGTIDARLAATIDRVRTILLRGAE